MVGKSSAASGPPLRLSIYPAPMKLGSGVRQSRRQLTATGHVPSPDGRQQVDVGVGLGSGAQGRPDQGQHGVVRRHSRNACARWLGWNCAASVEGGLGSRSFAVAAIAWPLLTQLLLTIAWIMLRSSEVVALLALVQIAITMLAIPVYLGVLGARMIFDIMPRRWAFLPLVLVLVQAASVIIQYAGLCFISGKLIHPDGESTLLLMAEAELGIVILAVPIFLSMGVRLIQSRKRAP